MLTTTGYNFEGYKITEYIGVISEAVVLGTGFLSSLGASFADFTGSNSMMYEGKLEKGKNEAMRKLEKQARFLNGNAIIGIDIDYTTFSHDVMGIVASGTVVKVEKEKQKTSLQSYDFPVLSYNSTLPFNVCSLNLTKNMISSILTGNILVKNYLNENNVTAIIADLEVEDLFGAKIMTENVIFTFKPMDKDDTYFSDDIEIPSDSMKMNLIRKAYVLVKKYILNDNGKVIEVDTNQNIYNSTISNSEMTKLKEVHGKGTVSKFVIEDNLWRCYCGASNDKSISVCERCGFEMNEFNKNVLNLQETNVFEFSSLIENVSLMKNAKEIYSYLESLGLVELEPVMAEIESLVKQERLYGNMKDSAISKLKACL